MMQRLVQTGGQRLAQAATAICGEMNQRATSEQWVSVDSPTPKDNRTQAGVYRQGNRLLAVNRAPQEDDAETLGANEAKALFGTVPTQLFAEKSRTPATCKRNCGACFCSSC